MDDVERIAAASREKRERDEQAKRDREAARDEQVRLANYLQGHLERRHSGEGQFGRLYCSIVLQNQPDGSSRFVSTMQWPDEPDYFFRVWARDFRNFVRIVRRTRFAHRLDSIELPDSDAVQIARKVYELADSGEIVELSLLLREILQQYDADLRRDVESLIRHKIPYDIINGPQQSRCQRDHAVLGISLEVDDGTNNVMRQVPKPAAATSPKKPKRGNKTEGTRAVDRICRYIVDNSIAQPMQLTEMAGIAGCKPPTLCTEENKKLIAEAHARVNRAVRNPKAGHFNRSGGADGTYRTDFESIEERLDSESIRQTT